MFGFESFHDSDLGTWTQLVQDRLNLELKQLEAVRTERKAAGADEAAIATAQLEFLRDSGFRFAAFAGGSYAGRVRDIRTAIITWFDAPKTRRRLKAAMGGTINTDVLRQLWMNFQASDFAGSSHMNALSLDSHFGQVLASLAKVGPLAPVLAAGRRAEPPPCLRRGSLTRHARPRARSMSRPRIRSPSARRPLCSYSLVTQARAPPMSAAVSSEKTRST